MKGIGKILDKKYGELCFGLFCGCAYFIIILRFIIENTAAGGGLLGFFFFPAIVCGAALFVIKLIRNLREKERFNAVNLFIYIHLLVFFAAVASAVYLAI